MASKKKKDLKKNKKAKGKKIKAEKLPPQPKRNFMDPLHLGVLGAILLISFISFYPSLDNNFVNWDDDKNFYENELITSLNDNNFWENTKKIFTTDVIGGYNPLTIWTFLLEKKSYGFDQPSKWHRNNILLHLLCVFFIFLIGRRLKLSLIATSVLALLFAIHPMRVESVAWVTERKDVLFGVFYLAAMFQYIKGKQEGFKATTWFIIGLCFLLSLLSKIQAVIFPISMILIDYYLSKSSKITIRSIFSKAPFLIGSLIIGLVNIHFLRNQGSITQQEYHGIDRLFIGSYSLVVYYIKSLVPFRLSPLYPYPAKLTWEFYAAIIPFLGSFAFLGLAYIKKWKAWFFGLGFFLANIVLLLQIVGAGQGFIADRFTYIAYFGLFFLMAYFFDKMIKNKPNFKMPGLVFISALLIGYAYMTFNQNKVWKDSGTLWTHVLKYYKNSTLPWGNRANFYRDNQQTQQALYDYNRVIRLKPDAANAYNSLARLYFNFNQRDSLLKALQNYNKAIQFDPNDVEYHVNRGATFAKLGDFPNALANLNKAETIDPSFQNIYLNRSVIFNQQGDYTNALKDINKYLNIRPNMPDMWYEKTRLHNALGDYKSGFDAINKALSLQQKGMYYFERAKCNYVLNNVTQAQQDLRTAEQMGFKGDATTINKILGI